MNKALRIILGTVGVIIIIIISTIVQVYNYTSGNYPSNYEKQPITKEQYLKVVDDNYSADSPLTREESRCVYSYIIDKYGVDVAIGMDNDADKSDKNGQAWTPDSRIIEAIKACNVQLN